MLYIVLYVFFFFFSSRRRHTRYWRDWSSDVCSSDLSMRDTFDADQPSRAATSLPCQPPTVRSVRSSRASRRSRTDGVPTTRDRKSVVSGKSVDLGGRRIIKKKKHHECSTRQAIRRSK